MCPTVSTGGALFERYIECYSSDQVFNTYESIVAVCTRRRNRMNDDEMKVLTDMVGKKFHGYVLWALRNIGNRGNQQNFYHTHVAKYHGLSRLGINLLSKYGYMLHLSVYDTYNHKHWEAARDERTYVVIP